MKPEMKSTQCSKCFQFEAQRAESLLERKLWSVNGSRISQDTLEPRSRRRKNLRCWSLLTSVWIGANQRLFLLIGRLLQSVFRMLGVGLAASKALWSRGLVAVAVAEGTQVVGVVLQKIHAGGVHVVEGYRQV